ncbi:LacI family DNA-binding transcriptional regulator [Streptosporangium sp. NPDC050855]|uniref:LacI family DNA-binding transcriptional regulator n=1 Tax=Streptosporangium sp. NPDC050855 TaxID=3366194 RepID=UPI0037AE7D25
MPKRATIYDVAKEAGVSISTVSLAINHPQRVNEATRRVVIDTAVRLGYRGATPASAGRRVAVAAPFSAYPSYYTRLTGILAASVTAGIEVIVHDLPSTAAEDAPVLDALPVKANIDGIIVMGAPLSGQATRTESLPGPPVVLVDVPDGARHHPGVPSVLIDDRRGGALIGEHLAGRGHRKVAFVHETQRSTDYLSAGMLRAQGLADHLTCVDVPVNDPTAPWPELSSAMEDERITAVVANHDRLAAALHGPLSTIAERPMALAGYDGSELAAALGLTTVWQPFEESGRAAMGLLTQLINGEHAHLNSMSLTPRLVARASTAGAVH